MAESEGSLIQVQQPPGISELLSLISFLSDVETYKHRIERMEKLRDDVNDKIAKWGDIASLEESRAGIEQEREKVNKARSKVRERERKCELRETALAEKLDGLEERLRQREEALERGEQALARVTQEAQSLKAEYERRLAKLNAALSDGTQDEDAENALQ